MRIEKGHEFTFSEENEEKENERVFMDIHKSIFFCYADASQYSQKGRRKKLQF